MRKVNCRGCTKEFSTTFNRNKHERLAGHGPINSGSKTEFGSKNGIYKCPIKACVVTATSKQSIQRHFKNCSLITKNKRHEPNKICQHCKKKFTKKFILQKLIWSQ